MKKTMLITIKGFIFLIAVYSCANKKDNTETVSTPVVMNKDTSQKSTVLTTVNDNQPVIGTAVNKPVNDAPVNKPMIATLVGKELPESDYSPQCEIYLSVNGVLKKIKKINICNTIGKEEYKEKGIPANAISAIGGWWAGGGEYYYLIMRESKPVVYYGWQDEGQEDIGYHWKPVTIK